MRWWMKGDKAHTVLNNFVSLSRVTEYEKGLKFGLRLEERNGEWGPDWKMADERFLMCKRSLHVCMYLLLTQNPSMS